LYMLKTLPNVIPVMLRLGTDGVGSDPSKDNCSYRHQKV
jgi:hypothetical protein